MAKQFSQISQKKQAPAATKKEIKLQKEALVQSKNTSSQPPESNLSSKNEKDIKPTKGMKYKKVLKPKKTVKDSVGDWEVVENTRESYLVEKPVMTDSEDGDSSDSD